MIFRYNNKVAKYNGVISSYDPFLITGGTIYYDGDYIMYTYVASGTFLFKNAYASTINASTFVIGGGGCGTATNCPQSPDIMSGGGGAGGLSISNVVLYPNIVYDITVGGSPSAAPTLNGGNSLIVNRDASTLISRAYGGGSAYDDLVYAPNSEYNIKARSGGSGAGGGYYNLFNYGTGNTAAGGSDSGTSSHYGNAGGPADTDKGGGGGGAGSQPSNENGGSGITLNLTGADVIYAAGGNGGKSSMSTNYNGSNGSGGAGGYTINGTVIQTGLLGIGGIVCIKFKYK